MPRFAANLSLLYTERPFLERFEAAATDGFEAVEYLFPYAWPAWVLAARLKAHGLQQVLFNAPPGGVDAASFAAAWDAGSRGTAAWCGREAEFRAGVVEALRYAAVLDCPRIHLMSGTAPAVGDAAAWRSTWVRSLRWAAQQAAAEGREVLIEPINPRDMPGYVLNRQDQAHALLDEVGAANLKVQMDLYHCQVVEGEVSAKLRRYLPTGRVGHLQVAGVPERHEPDTGELRCEHLFDLIDETGYTGWVGCEYHPRRGAVPGGTSQGLGWLRQAQGRGRG